MILTLVNEHKNSEDGYVWLCFFSHYVHQHVNRLLSKIKLFLYEVYENEDWVFMVSGDFFFFSSWAPPVGCCCHEVMDVIAARKQNKKNKIVLVHWEICFRQILYLFKGNLIFPLIWWCRCEMMDVIATGECWAKSSQGQGCQTFSRLIINITNYTDQKSWRMMVMMRSIFKVGVRGP